jgi:hypothetical protein
MAFCSICGTQYGEGTRFCPKCGAPTTAVQLMAPPVYAPPPQQAPYGGYASPSQAPYPNYAPPPQPIPYNNMQAQQRYGSRKSKSTAIILAILFSFWGWLYTFKKDSIKFFLSLAASAITSFFIFEDTMYELYFVYALLWLWIVITALTRKSEWYAQY